MDRETGSRSSLTSRVDVLGVGVNTLDLDQTTAIIGHWITNRQKHYVCVTGVHGVMESQRDPDLKRIHNASGLTTPDGMPLVWCGKYAGAGWVRRVYGPDLMLELCRVSVDLGWRHFFYGAAPGVPEVLADRLRARFPGLVIAGTFSPPYRPLHDEEVSRIGKLINESEADVVWVGLSTPKQELWMDRFRPLLDAPVMIGVGAAFDIHSGRVSQAPIWMRRSGLEWLFRLSREPGRLWRRYFDMIPRFMWAITRSRPRLLDPWPSD